MSDKKLGVGFIGAGFIARFHMLSWVGVRDADVLGVWCPPKKMAEETAAYARSLNIGDTKAYNSITEMVADPDIDCLWVCGPNDKRVENFEEIAEAIATGKGSLKAIACEKPLGRNVAEARKIVELTEKMGVLHGYLEDQIYAPSLTRSKEIVWKRGAGLSSRPYLARAAEEHGGPHSPWFWIGSMQGGGVLNDMMCHSVEVVRFLLTKPGSKRQSIKPVKVSAQINSLKWSRPEFARQLQERFGEEVDYRKAPSEDYARATITFEDEEGYPLVGEVTTSWNFVGAGLRLSSELLGPEYSMGYNSLNSSTNVFFSREIHGDAGEDLVEKQNAEQGLMPVVGDEASEYGYTGENRHFIEHFLKGEQPEGNFYAGLEVVELLMTAYMSAEQEKTIKWKPDNLESFVPQVAKGTWRP